MISFFQHTLAAAVRFEGVGIHSGRVAQVAVKPAPADFGIRFVRLDLDDQEPICASADAVCETRLGTVIGRPGGATISTIEHLMAVFAGIGIDNALVEIDGSEAPILEGSAAVILDAIDRGGLRRLDAPRRHIEILEPLEIVQGGKRVALLPASQFELAVEIAFDDPAIGRQSLDLAMDEAVFRSELAHARTFGFLADVEGLRRAGLGQGASLENTVVVDGGRVLNPEGLRWANEFVRHKALDAIGDLYLAGAPIIGRYEAHCAGHALNNALVRALMAAPHMWRLVTRTPELAEAV